MEFKISVVVWNVLSRRRAEATYFRERPLVRAAVTRTSIIPEVARPLHYFFYFSFFGRVVLSGSPWHHYLADKDRYDSPLSAVISL